MLEFAKKIVKTTEEIFSIMIFLEISSGEPFSEGMQAISCHVSAMLGLSGDFAGLLSIHCPEKVGLAISGSMLGMDLEIIDDDVKDALGEITNMIAGGLKQALAAENIGLESAISTTISGKAYTLSSPTGSDRVIIPFDIEQRRFFVELKFSHD